MRCNDGLRWTGGGHWHGDCRALHLLALDDKVGMEVAVEGAHKDGKEAGVGGGVSRFELLR